MVRLILKNTFLTFDEEGGHLKEEAYTECVQNPSKASSPRSRSVEINRSVSSDFMDSFGPGKEQLDRLNRLLMPLRSTEDANSFSGLSSSTAEPIACNEARTSTRECPGREGSSSSTSSTAASPTPGGLDACGADAASADEVASFAGSGAASNFEMEMMLHEEEATIPFDVAPSSTGKFLPSSHLGMDNHQRIPMHGLTAQSPVAPPMMLSEQPQRWVQTPPWGQHYAPHQWPHCRAAEQSDCSPMPSFAQMPMPHQISPVQSPIQSPPPGSPTQRLRIMQPATGALPQPQQQQQRAQLHSQIHSRHGSAQLGFEDPHEPVSFASDHRYEQQACDFMRQDDRFPAGSFEHSLNGLGCSPQDSRVSRWQVESPASASSSQRSKEYRHAHVPKTVDLQKEYGKNNNNQVEITTLMIRNIPNHFTQKQLIAELEHLGFAGSFDFLYIPLDKGTLSNVGYAFVNFVTPLWAAKCIEVFQDYRFKRHRKVAATSIAHLQGLEANLAHYENSVVSSAKLKQRRPVVIANLSNQLSSPPSSTP